MPEKPDLTQPKNFFSWVLYGLSGAVAAVSVALYTDMKKQRDDAVVRVNAMTDKIWEKDFKITSLKKDSIDKIHEIKTADSVLRESTITDATNLLKSRK